MSRIIRSVMVAGSMLLWTTAAAAQGYGGGPGSGYPMFGWGHMMYGGLMMIAFWAAIIILVVLLVRWLGGAHPGDRPGQDSGSSALRILEERFARGEIDREEFEERKRILSK